MSMVKAYHGKRCSELQLCCSSWSVATTLPRVPLTRDIQMEKYETWNWETSLTSNKHRSESKNEMENFKYIPLDPPLEFRDDSIFPTPVEKFAFDFVLKLMSDAFLVSCKITWSIPCSQYCHMSDSLLPNHPTPWNGFHLCWTPELLPNKRLSSLSASHNSLSTISSGNMDDSSYIKSAISHDVLTSKQISDMYNVPFDSDIYAMPVDMVREKEPDKGRRTCESEHYVTTSKSCQKEGKNRKSRSADASAREPIHVTVEEVRGYLHTLYSNDTAGSRSSQEVAKQIKNPFKLWQGNINGDVHTNGLKTKINYIPSGKLKKAKESMDISGNRAEKFKKYRQSFPANFKETLCSIFRIKKLSSPDRCFGRREAESGSDEIGIRLSGHEDLNPPSPISKPPFLKRALPPLPKLSDEHGEIIVTDRKSLPSAEVPSPPPLPFRTKQPSISVDFVSSIEKVKDYGWYWGPITGEAAEKILSNEPDGSFIVRDSSDDYYIFSLTFKLNSIIRHVRIEHDKGNFSFGSSTRFKSHTIVDFIENAVEHSRSGRYLFFLHRRPVLGPMRVQLLHPVSRFKQVQSLQHMCRFVILKMVRRDLIPYLPLPRRVLDYLSTQHYYSEDLIDDDGKGSAREDLEKLLPFRQEVFS